MRLTGSTLDLNGNTITDVGNITSTGDITAQGSDIYIGENGDGDARLRFYDDNSNAWRTLYWDDSANVFRLNNNVLIDGTLDMGNDRITRVATPSASTDAANKAYVDANAGGGSLQYTTRNGSRCSGRGGCTSTATCPSGWTAVSCVGNGRSCSQRFSCASDDSCGGTASVACIRVN